MEPAHAAISLQRQCELIGLARASYYYPSTKESAENLRLMHLIDEQYTETPFYGVRKMTAWLNEVKRENVNVKCVRRLMRLMGLKAIYAKPHLSRSAPGHQIYPYLLRHVKLTPEPSLEYGPYYSKQLQRRIPPPRQDVPPQAEV